ncbi:cell division protein FtsI (penicillin-binding protein 3) [Dysgonomonadaceae bacterium PH5-43]|nr:cell division protein FtsI (penicillin-binding protein 3) [Dysgonomonadaceae bacterium PH5-43]
MSSGQSVNKKIITYYSLIVVAVVVIAILIFGKACITSVRDGDKWIEHGKKQVRSNVAVPPMRGNIYSSDYKLMAATEPRYRLYIDFWAEGISRDTLMKYVKPLADELHKLLPKKTSAQYENHILNGWQIKERAQNQIKAGKKNVKQNREYKVFDHDVNYLQWRQILKMPYFNKGRNRSGLYERQLTSRTKPYGTLASRTIGDVYGEVEKGGKNGLEAYYDSLLRGEAGTSTRRKVNGKYISVVDEKPINGKDIISTIDIDIQDITEKALLNKVKEIDAESGTAVVMEVATGEIKAITNMGRIREGVWSEVKNYAVSDMSEPGSTFKVVSMMVALEDGLVHPEDSIDTGNGVAQIAGQTLKDHNANRGGYGKITAAKSIRYSSNIGVAKLIMKAYGDNPSKYVEGIRRIGITQDMKLEIPGYGVAKVRHPKETGGAYWSRSTLPWMSFGYETNIPPIYTLSFFNAIANNGTLVKPMFVKEIIYDGKVVEKKKPTVINEHICSDNTLAAIRQMLDDVVNTPDGTGKPARSNKVRISGKTGTAQISQGAAGYKSGGLSHQVSFCGYFPSDKPQYSIIVVIRKPRVGIASGGSMCGAVFKNIAEEVYAKKEFYKENSFPVDTLHPIVPYVKAGLAEPSLIALNNLKVNYNDNQLSGEWLDADVLDSEKLILKEKAINKETIPNVKGMGAKNAVYVLEGLGLRVNLSGKGKVASQSITPGTKIAKGQTIALQLK